MTAPPIWEEIQAYCLPTLITDKVTGWRTRAKLAVRGNVEIGLFKAGTHDVVDIAACPLHHPSIDKAILLLRKAMQACRISAYDEKTLKGLVRYAQFFVERKTGKVQLTLVLNAPHCPENFIDYLARDPLFHSIWINVQQLYTNRIFGDEWKHCCGEKYLWEEYNGIKVAFHPACFSQAHASLFEKMLLSIKSLVKPGQRIVEYYAGVGAIGLTLASEAKHLTCIEINPFAKECFALSSQHPAHFEVGATDEKLSFLNDADVVIVDPPRKGLSRAFIDALIAAENVKQLIYVSCGFDSFKRDVTILQTAGWRLEKCEGYLFFPGTNHVELLASLVR